MKIDTRELLFTFGHRERYPHLSPEDTDLWEEFMRQYPMFCTHVYYDMPVGCIPPHIQANRGELSQWYLNKTYCKRIDVVAIQSEVPIVIELKPHAGADSLGQVLLYRHCLSAILDDNTPPRSMIITNLADTDLINLAPKYGVQIINLTIPEGGD